VLLALITIIASVRCSGYFKPLEWNTHSVSFSLFFIFFFPCFPCFHPAGGMRESAQ
jgi:hypothetical protein